MTEPAAVQTDEFRRCGVVGAGAIGGNLAARLAETGLEVSIYDLDAARAESLAASGVTAAGSARALAERSQVVLLALPDSPQVLACLDGEDGLEAGLRSGSAVLLMGTVDPETPVLLEQRLRPLGVEVLDAPVSGGPVAARRGELAIMVGASERAYARCRDVLERMGRAVHVGEVGAGETTKLVNNLMGAVIAVGIAEGLALAAKSGIDVERAREAIAGGSGGSWILSEWLPRTVLSDPDATHFAIDLMCKDMRLVRELAERLEVPLQAGALAERTFTELRDAGDGGRDFSILVKRRAEAVGASLDGRLSSTSAER